MSVSARLTFTRAAGAGHSTVVSIPAQRRLDYDLNQPPVGGTGRFSVAVQTMDPARPLVSEHSGYATPSTFAAGRNDLGGVPSPYWYFGEGVANAYFDETLSIFNPTNGPVRASVTLVRAGAAPVTYTYVIAQGPGRADVRINDVFTGGDHGTIVTAVVDGTSTPANVVVQRTLRWPIGSTAESSTSSGVNATGLNWYFAEGCKTSGCVTYVALMNPSAMQADVTLHYLHSNGQTYTETVSIPSMRRVTATPPAGVPNGGFGIHAVGTNSVPFVVERSWYAIDFSHGLSGAPVGAPAATWRFAEGKSDGFFDTYFVVMNPSFTTASTVTFNFRKADGTTATTTVTVQPRNRALVYADGVPGIGTASYGTEVTTTGAAVVVERSMYWPQGSIGGSHISMGRPQ